MSHPLLAKTDHRPFPIPQSAWVMTQAWEQLLFAHWPVKAETVADLLPRSLELDLFDNSAWIGVVPFAMKNVHPRFTPAVPVLSNFLELNVRTYVTRNGIAGVYFFSLDCSNPIAVWVAKTIYHLPYFNATMQSTTSKNGLVTYESKRANSGAQFKATYKPTGGMLQTTPTSIDRFLTERYCLYTTDPKGRLYRGVIHHDTWPLQPAEAEISINTMTTCELGLELPAQAPLLHYSERIDTIEWPLVGII